MSQSENTLQVANHEMLIRVDADVRHLSSNVHGIKARQDEQDKMAQKLSESLHQLTYNVGALVEGMKDAKDAMHTIGKHEQRIKALEDDMATCSLEREEMSQITSAHHDALEKGKFLWKIVWAIVTTPVAIAILYATAKFLNTIH